MNRTNTISLADAQNRIHQLLNFAAQMPTFSSKPNAVPKAVLIPTIDVIGILEQYGYQISPPVIPLLLEMRLYFGLEDTVHEYGDSDFGLSGMLVPVLINGNPARSDDLGLTVEDTDMVQTNIYDFSQPCPNYCDISSQIYNLSS